MDILAYAVGGIAFIIALFIATTGVGNGQERFVRAAIPSPLYLGAPVCGAILQWGPSVPVAVGLAHIAIVVSVLALASLIVLVGAVMWPT